ncbi:MAG: 5'-3' exonuclease H3TH domain-containing protein, partial [bacterium]
LALIGDTADNIDGVRGVGSKTAAKLLLKHGSVDAIYRELADVKSPAIRDALAAARDIVYRNISLVRLSRDLASVPGWEGSSVRAENPSQLLEFFRDLELGSLVKELERNAEKSILMLDHEVGTDTMFSNH